MALRTPSTGDGRTEVRVGRRSLESRAPGGSWRDIRSVGIVIGVALVSTVIVITLVASLLGPARFFRVLSPSGAASGSTDGPPTIDVDIENLIAGLRDGRQSRGTYTLRMRENTAPRNLIDVARRTPTAASEIVSLAAPGRPGVSKPPPNPNSDEALAREIVNAAVSRLSYEETKAAVGKQVLKDTIRESFSAAFPTVELLEIYVREYLVQ